jgi:hypothetical protein
MGGRIHPTLKFFVANTDPAARHAKPPQLLACAAALFSKTSGSAFAKFTG